MNLNECRRCQNETQIEIVFVQFAMQKKLDMTQFLSSIYRHTQNEQRLTNILRGYLSSGESQGKYNIDIHFILSNAMFPNPTEKSFKA